MISLGNLWSLITSKRSTVTLLVYAKAMQQRQNYQLDGWGVKHSDSKYFLLLATYPKIVGS